MKHSHLNVAALLLLIAVALPSMAADTDTSARSLYERYSDAVLTVKLVINQEMSFGGREGMKQESKGEVTGTVLSEDGLLVVSLSATDPSGMMKKMMGSMSASQQQMKFNTELSDIKIIRPDGSEVDAEIVLRDRDLDLAFIRPQEKQDEPFTAIDLSETAEPALLDEVIIMNRLGKVARRTMAASLGRVAAIVEKPRTFYVVEQNNITFGLGAPVFAADERPVGVVLMRSIETSGQANWMSMFSGANNFGILPIVLPFVDVLESAEQVPPMEDKEPSDAEPMETETTAVQ